MVQAPVELWVSSVPTSGLPQAAAALRQQKLDSLRARIRRIELAADAGGGRAGQASHAGPEDEAARSQRLAGRVGPPWRLGADEVDALLGPDGLEIGGVHEVKPAAGELGASWAAAWAAALVFSLALGIRRRAPGPILCCRPAALASELGGLYGPGLCTLDLAPDRLVIVEAANAADTLWAVEEGLRSGSLALVLGVLDAVALTPARRLALAAAAHRSPCLLLTHPRAEATAATATRWRVGPAPSAPHPLDEQAPGAPRFMVDLERCRAQPLSAATASFSLEWCDEALCFRLAPGMADRADAACRSGRGAR
ncbi:MAG: hypothetical protein KJZ80_13815 [Hyphomicrobiaceae bacterium]|nr:hypothetical protein [Hyphomicrobiaceae bacterium]